MSQLPTRPLDPAEISVLRGDRLRHYVDVSGSLPSGVSLASASVSWGEREPTGTVTDRTSLFGNPTVELNPAPVPASGGGTQGGTGWVAFTPVMSDSLAAGSYELLLRLTLSFTEVVVYAQTWEVSGYGDGG